MILAGIGYLKYSSPKSKRMYSDHAKIALLVMMEYRGKSFAKFAKILPSLGGVIKEAGISGIPDRSTLRKFRARPDAGVLDGRNEEARRSKVMFKCIAHNFRIGMELSSSGMKI